MTELTPQQKEERNRIVKENGEQLRDKGVFGTRKRNPEILWHTHCVVCGKENPEGLARVCSGECYQKSPD
jgi:hypothetical protein